MEYSWTESRPELAADSKCGFCGLGWMGQWTEWLAMQGGGRAACRLPSPTCQVCCCQSVTLRGFILASCASLLTIRSAIVTGTLSEELD